MGNVYTANYIPKNILFYLWEKEINTVVLKQDPGIRGAVTSHPDLFLCKMGVEADAPLIRAPKGAVGSAYPENAAYCAACLDKYLIHNLKITAPEILKKARQMGKTPVHVEQGYTRCNLVVVDGRSVITADEGICRVLSGLADLDVLKVTPGHVELPGFDTGFLGGASGRVENTMLFCGDLSRHPDYYEIVTFIMSRGLDLKFFDSFPLLDVGSLIESDF